MLYHEEFNLIKGKNYRQYLSDCFARLGVGVDKVITKPCSASSQHHTSYYLGLGVSHVSAIGRLARAVPCSRCPSQSHRFPPPLSSVPRPRRRSSSRLRCFIAEASLCRRGPSEPVVVGEGLEGPSVKSRLTGTAEAPRVSCVCWWPSRLHHHRHRLLGRRSTT